jgi:WD40 repeat protein
VKSGHFGRHFGPFLSPSLRENIPGFAGGEEAFLCGKGCRMTKVYSRILVLALAMFSRQATHESLSISWTQITTDSAYAIDWSPDGDKIAVGSVRTDFLVVFDLNQNIYSEPALLVGEESISGWEQFSRWSPNGHYVMTVAQGRIFLFRIQENSELVLYQTFSSEVGYYVIARWSSDSTRLAALVPNGYIEIIDVESGEIAQTIDLGEHGEISYPAFDWTIDDAIFAAPYYSTVASNMINIGFWDRAGNLLETSVPQTQGEYRSGNYCYSYGENTGETYNIEWGSDGTTLAIAGPSGYGICTLALNNTIEQYTLGTEFTHILRWSPDQRWLASATSNFSGEQLCGVRLTDLHQNYQTTEAPIGMQSCSVNSVSWSPDGQRLAVGTSRGIWIATLELDNLKT